MIGDWERDCKRPVANITMLSCVVFIVPAQVLASITRHFFLHRHFFFTVGVVHKQLATLEVSKLHNEAWMRIAIVAVDMQLRILLIVDLFV